MGKFLKDLIHDNKRYRVFWTSFFGLILCIGILYWLIAAPRQANYRIAQFLKQNEWLISEFSDQNAKGQSKIKVAPTSDLFTLTLKKNEVVHNLEIATLVKTQEISFEQIDSITRRNLSLELNNFNLMLQLKPLLTNVMMTIPESGERGAFIKLNKPLPYSLVLTEAGNIYSIQSLDNKSKKNKITFQALSETSHDKLRIKYFSSLKNSEAAAKALAEHSIKISEFKKQAPILPLSISVTNNNKSKPDQKQVKIIRNDPRTTPSAIILIATHKPTKKNENKNKNAAANASKDLSSDTTKKAKLVLSAIIVNIESASNAAADAVTRIQQKEALLNPCHFGNSSSSNTGGGNGSGSSSSEYSSTTSGSGGSTESSSSTSSLESCDSSSSDSSSSSSEHCYEQDSCAYKNGGGVCTQCLGITALGDAICNADDEPELVPTPCASNECCIGMSCTEKTGDVSLSLGGCMEGPNPDDTGRCSPPEEDIWYSNDSVISGTASVSGLNTDSPECTLTVTSGVGRIEIDPETCKPGTGSCSFTITRDLTPGSLMCGVVTATASSACCSKETVKIAGLSNYGFTFSPGGKTVREGPIEPARRPRIQLIPYPNNLKITDHSEALKPNPDYRNLNGPTATTEKVDPSKGESKNNGIFRITNSWWVGVLKDPPKADLCYEDLNDYKLSATATMEAKSCSLSYDSLKDQIFFTLKSKFAAEGFPSGTTQSFLNKIVPFVKIKTDWRTAPRGESYCIVKASLPRSGSFSHLLAPGKVNMPWDPIRDQYYPIAKIEEQKHIEQAISLKWSDGGLFDVLDWKYVHMSRQTFSAPNCYAATLMAYAEVGKSLKPMVDFLYSYTHGGDFMCWKEQRAKELIGWDASKASMHFECGYPECSKQSTAPLLPFVEFLG